MADTPTSLRARAQRLSSERARLIEKLRREEWKFEQDLSLGFVAALGHIRAEITEKERDIVRLVAQAELLDLAATAKGYADLPNEFVIS